MKQQLLSPKQNVAAQLQDLVANYQNRVIRSSTDYTILTIGNLQIENLDWIWEGKGVELSSVLMFDPYDWMFRYNLDGNGDGIFKVTKYGLTNEVSLDSYTPLWKPGTDPYNQAKTMWREMKKMEENGSRQCKNGIEITKKSPLWNVVDSLANQGRNTFRTLLMEKVKSGIQTDGKKLWDAGVEITPDVLQLVQTLERNLYKHVTR